MPCTNTLNIVDKYNKLFSILDKPSRLKKTKENFSIGHKIIMIGILNHIAIAVPDLDASIDTYKNIFGASVGEMIELIEHGVTVVFVDLPNTKIELITPLGKESPIKGFLERNPNGGIHHICYEVRNINESRKRVIEVGAKLAGSGEPKIGAHGKPVLFLHPKDFNGTLIELEES